MISDAGKDWNSIKDLLDDVDYHGRRLEVVFSRLVPEVVGGKVASQKNEVNVLGSSRGYVVVNVIGTASALFQVFCCQPCWCFCVCFGYCATVIAVAILFNSLCYCYC